MRPIIVCVSADSVDDFAESLLRNREPRFEPVWYAPVEVSEILRRIWHQVRQRMLGFAQRQLEESRLQQNLMGRLFPSQRMRRQEVLGSRLSPVMFLLLTERAPFLFPVNQPACLWTQVLVLHLEDLEFPVLTNLREWEDWIDDSLLL